MEDPGERCVPAARDYECCMCHGVNEIMGLHADPFNSCAACISGTLAQSIRDSPYTYIR